MPRICPIDPHHFTSLTSIHTDATSMPHRCHFDATSIPDPRHIDATSICIDATSSHIDATSKPSISFSFFAPLGPPEGSLWSCFTFPLPLFLLMLLFPFPFAILGPPSICHIDTPHRCQYRCHIDDTSMPHRCHIDPTSMPRRCLIDATSTLHRATSMPHQSTSMPHRCHIDPIHFPFIFALLGPLERPFCSCFFITLPLFHLIFLWFFLFVMGPPSNHIDATSMPHRCHIDATSIFIDCTFFPFNSPLNFPFHFGSSWLSWAPSSYLSFTFSLFHLIFLFFFLYILGPPSIHIDATSMPHRCHIDSTSMPHRCHIDSTSIHIDATSMQHRFTSISSYLPFPFHFGPSWVLLSALLRLVLLFLYLCSF